MSLYMFVRVFPHPQSEVGLLPVNVEGEGSVGHACLAVRTKLVMRRDLTVKISWGGDEELNRIRERVEDTGEEWTGSIIWRQAAILARNLLQRLTNTVAGSFTPEEVTTNSISLGLCLPRLLVETFFM
jgi:hypothetical protein